MKLAAGDIYGDRNAAQSHGIPFLVPFAGLIQNRFRQRINHAVFFGFGNEFGRRDQHAVGRAPPRQSLQPDDMAGFDIDLRLEKRVDFAVFNRVFQIAAHIHADRRFQRQIRAIYAHRAFFVRPHLPQRQIGVGNQLLQIFAVLRTETDADADRQIEFQIVNEDRAVETAQNRVNPFFHPQREFQSRHQNGEVVAAGLRQKIVFRQVGTDAFRNAGGDFRAQSLIRNGVQLSQTVRRDRQHGDLRL